MREELWTKGYIWRKIRDSLYWFSPSFLKCSREGERKDHKQEVNLMGLVSLWMRMHTNEFEDYFENRWFSALFLPVGYLCQQNSVIINDWWRDGWGKQCQVGFSSWARVSRGQNCFPNNTKMLFTFWKSAEISRFFDGWIIIEVKKNKRAFTIHNT